MMMMKRVFLERPKARRAKLLDPLPIDPRDPDVVRAKSRMYAAPVKRSPREN